LISILLDQGEVRAQLHIYLKAIGLALGYMINFGHQEKLQWQRVLMSDNLIEDEL